MLTEHAFLAGISQLGTLSQARKETVMRRQRLLSKALVSMSAVLAGGMVLGDGCMSTLATTNLCGTVFPWCTPADQLNLMWPILDIPDYSADPSCTIPLGCGSGDLFYGEGDHIPDNFPGGDEPVDPEDDQTGTGGGGGS
jgi:hypothetical protein